MNFNGTINLKKPIQLNGMHHGHEILPTLPTWQASDKGRMIFTNDTARAYVGGSSDWEEITQSASNTDYDYRYYTKTQTDGFFGPESAGKKTIDWVNVNSKPSTFIPTTHDNTSHSQQYITLESVTFEALQTNGSVGTGTTQVAVGNHNHDSVYSTIGHNHNGTYEPIISVKNSAFNVDFGTSHATVAYGDHNHDSIYEPTITKKSAFNVDFGTDHTTAAYGDHLHNGTYEPVFSKNSGFNLEVGTTAGTVAAGDHVHDSVYVKQSDLYTNIYNKSEVYSKGEVDSLISGETTVYEPVIAVKKSAFNVDFGTSHTEAAYGDHSHSETYEPIISLKKTAFNVNFGGSSGDAAEGNHLHDERYISVEALNSKPVGTITPVTLPAIIIPSDEDWPSNSTDTVKIDALNANFGKPGDIMIHEDKIYIKTAPGGWKYLTVGTLESSL